ncbi:MAG: 8-oxo-dGTP diphosphatase [Elusimicrobia bacterium]|nr:8-oxo-dGTP diphosphatase [Elusimicrobiota bacterium]
MANAYETGERKAIPAVLIYPERDGEILMLHRNKRPQDFHAGKWNGLGGKCEPDESPLETARRELHEEAGLDLPLERLRPLGIIQFPNFKPKAAEDWLVYVFLADVPGGGPPPACPEGTLEWIPRDKVPGLNLWSGDRHFLPLVLERKPFVATMWYKDGDCVRHWIQPL